MMLNFKSNLHSPKNIQLRCYHWDEFKNPSFIVSNPLIHILYNIATTKLINKISLILI